MSGLIVKSLSNEHGGYDKLIDVLNNEISKLLSEIKLTNELYKHALVDRNHLFRECRRLRTENNGLKNKLARISM